MKHTLTPQLNQTAHTYFNVGQALFTTDYLLQVAKDSGFHKRAPRKIHACDLLAVICAKCIDGSPSCNDLALLLDSNSLSQGPTRQAVSLRMGTPFESFIRQLLEDVIFARVGGGAVRRDRPYCSKTFSGYRRVIAQDSTIIQLPSHLFPEFSGVSNSATSVCNARIQSTYDLLTGALVGFSVDPYSKNDQKAAPELPLMEGDLVLRDRGYLVMNEIKRHLDAGADCIYRHRTGATYLDPETRQPIDLPALLRDRGHLDMQVLLNNEEQTPVRLVCAPVDQETANLRRMKAKKENRGHNPSKAVLELLSWTIFITTIPAERASFQRILGLYGLRWRIEVIFKAWKSHMSFAKLHQVSRSQMMILIKARLLLITCCTNILYGSLSKAIKLRYQRDISLLKLVRFLSSAPIHFLHALDSLSMTDDQNHDYYKSLKRYCCYDRRKRKNFVKTFESLDCIS